jgi:hypothetical protein
VPSWTFYVFVHDVVFLCFVLMRLFHAFDRHNLNKSIKPFSFDLWTSCIWNSAVDSMFVIKGVLVTTRNLSRSKYLYHLHSLHWFIPSVWPIKFRNRFEIIRLRTFYISYIVLMNLFFACDEQNLVHGVKLFFFELFVLSASFWWVHPIFLRDKISISTYNRWVSKVFYHSDHFNFFHGRP